MCDAHFIGLHQLAYDRHEKITVALAGRRYRRIQVAAFRHGHACAPRSRKCPAAPVGAHVAIILKSVESVPAVGVYPVNSVPAGAASVFNRLAGSKRQILS